MNIIDVAAALVFHAGRLLITQRYDDSHLGGLWEFPGGKREVGETFESCLSRELLEELGMHVVVVELFDTIVHSYPEKTVRLQFYICTWEGKGPQAIGCQDFRWVTAEELGQFEFPAADVQLLEKLRTTPRLWLDK